MYVPVCIYICVGVPVFSGLDGDQIFTLRVVVRSVSFSILTIFYFGDEWRSFIQCKDRGEVREG